MSGSRGMARRRSATGDNSDSAASGAEAGGCLIGGANGLPALEIANREPTREEIVSWLAKKRDNSPLGTVKEKLSILKPIVDAKKEWIDRAKRLPDKQKAKQIADAIDATVPTRQPPLRIKAADLAEILFDVYVARKAYVDASAGHIATTRTVISPFEAIEDIVSCASSFAAIEIRQGQEECLYQLNATESRRQYLQNGFLPKVPDRDCFFCNHTSIDCPNSNKSNQEKYEADLWDWRTKKEEADKEAKRSKSKAKYPRQPKKPEPYFQCHCNQFRCLGITDTGSSCPIKCINSSTGERYPMDASGCTCPLCQCKCCAAYGYNTRQALAVKRMIDSGDVATQEELKMKRSQQHFAFITAETMMTTVNAFTSSARAGKTLPSAAEINNTISRSIAQSTARLDPQQHSSLIRGIRQSLGNPSTRVHLPVPVQLSDGTTVSSGLRTVGSNNKRDHRARNNSLDASDNQAITEVPLRPYEDAFKVSSTTNSTLQSALIPKELAAFGNGSQQELERALAESQELANSQASTPEEEDIQLQRALALSASLAKNGSGANPIIIMSSPPPSTSPMTSNTSSISTGQNTGDGYLDRVMRRAHRRAMLTTEVEDLDDPTASPEVTFTSPHAVGVMQTLGDEQNTYLARAVNYFHEDNPMADSQEGYTHARNLFKAERDSKKPKAKKHKKGRN